MLVYVFLSDVKIYRSINLLFMFNLTCTAILLNFITLSGLFNESEETILNYEDIGAD